MITTYDALSNETRRQILDLLRERPRTVGDLVDQLDISQPGVSKHLRILKEAGLVNVRQDAQRRWYELNPQPLAEIYAWLSAYMPLWEDRYDRLDAYLQQLQEKEQSDDHQE